VRIDDAAVAVDAATVLASDHFPLYADIALPGTAAADRR
jgi:endonuclease/exonuclease/phosphatase family metal-dependent hydrolase